MIEPTEQLRKDVAKLGRCLDAILDHQLEDEQERMRAAGVSEKEIRWFVRAKRSSSSWSRDMRSPKRSTLSPAGRSSAAPPGCSKR